MIKMHPLIVVAVCIIFGSLGQISLKYGLFQIGLISLRDMFFSKFFNIIFQPFIFLGILLYAFSMFLWLVAISKLELSFAYPLLSIGYIIVAILSFIIFKENITLIRWTGIILIVIGCFLLTKSI
ncbi:MAG: SMR family transporter [Candidatus Pacearchaeota archaeon]